MDNPYRIEFDGEAWDSYATMLTRLAGWNVTIHCVGRAPFDAIVVGPDEDAEATLQGVSVRRLDESRDPVGDPFIVYPERIVVL
jgi:hypothetical protein